MRELMFLAIALLVCLFMINLAYGFQGTLRQLGSYQFSSRSLSASNDASWREEDFKGNRFADSWLRYVPLVFPEDLVMGIDLQKWDFDRERWSYLRGTWRTSGWWYYYIYTMLVKLPLGDWMLFIIAGAGAITCPRWRANWRDEMILLAPAFLILFFASCETGLNRHFRYILPIIPLFIVSASRVFCVFSSTCRAMQRIVACTCVWIAVSSLVTFPHVLSYFNEAVGGPLNGHHHLIGSNLDWGQDMRFLKDWVDSHPEARPLYVTSYLHLIDPNRVGIPAQGKVPSHQIELPGWYAIDQESLLDRSDRYGYLRRIKPVARVAYSFKIYHVRRSDLTAWTQ